MSTSYLSRSVTASTNTSYTVSMWIKFTKTSVASGSPYMWSCGANGTGAQGLYMNNSDMKLSYYGHTGYSSYNLSDGSLRDYFGWYHIVWSVNAGTGTCYINGVQQGSTFTGIAPLNAHGGTEMALNTYVGTAYTTYDDLAPLMSHVHFIDGTAYPATTFGETDSVTGEWRIKTDVSVTYGTNGFFLFKDNASVNDQSGNGNNFTATGNVTQTEDNPSNVFCTFNPLIRPVNIFYAKGNTRIEILSGNSWQSGFGTLGMEKGSGKYYMEFKVVNGVSAGFGIADFKSSGLIDRVQKGENRYIGEYANSYAYYDGGNFYYNGSSTSSGWNSFTTANIIGMAVDMDNMKLYFHKDGTYQNSGNPTAGTGGYSINDPENCYLPAVSINQNSACVNFGNGSFDGTAISSEGTNASGIGKFEYDVPTGYTALSTKGLNE